jgi:hypothetical protein
LALAEASRFESDAARAAELREHALLLWAQAHAARRQAMYELGEAPMNGTNTPWPDTLDDALRQFWPTMTAARLAAELTAKYGIAVSRSAVIGKAHRLGLSKPRPAPAAQASTAAIAGAQAAGARAAIGLVPSIRPAVLHPAGHRLSLAGHRRAAAPLL